MPTIYRRARAAAFNAHELARREHRRQEQALTVFADLTEVRVCACGCGGELRAFRFAPKGVVLPGHPFGQEAFPW